MNTESHTLFARALTKIPGGVNSPVRAFNAVGGSPLFLQRAQGSHVYDVDGNRYIDYVGSWGPAILGHTDSRVLDSLTQAAKNGFSFGAPCRLEVELAEFICENISGIDKVRMVNSGTEATMSAVRLARGYTGRSKLIKFAGCYHGHADCLLVKAGSGALTLGNPSSAGVPENAVADTILLQYNNVQQVHDVFSRYHDIAAVIVEPIAGNMSMVPANADFLKTLREQCSKHGSVLIFDEVMSGFRVAFGGATSLYGIAPDIVCYGKVIGGGMPVGAFAGKSEIMDQLSPLGAVYQAGTLSGNPLAMATGLATLKILLENPTLYDELQTRLEHMLETMQQQAMESGIAWQHCVRGAMFGFFFGAEQPVQTFDQVLATDKAQFRVFFHAMLDAGVYLAPSPYEAGFISMAHSDKDISHTLTASRKSFSIVKKTVK